MKKDTLTAMEELRAALDGFKAEWLKLIALPFMRFCKRAASRIKKSFPRGGNPDLTRRVRERKRRIVMYPTMEAVNSASHMQLCQWQRFLPSPGINRIGQPDFDKVSIAEAKIMTRICERVKEFGGFTPEISKEIGW